MCFSVAGARCPQWQIRRQWPTVTGSSQTYGREQHWHAGLSAVAHWHPTTPQLSKPTTAHRLSPPCHSIQKHSHPKEHLTKYKCHMKARYTVGKHSILILCALSIQKRWRLHTLLWLSKRKIFFLLQFHKQNCISLVQFNWELYKVKMKSELYFLKTCFCSYHEWLITTCSMKGKKSSSLIHDWKRCLLALITDNCLITV